MGNNFIKGVLLVSVLVGTIVGVGIFAVPYTVMKSGPVWGFFLLILLGLVSLCVHIFYGDITLSCKKEKRLVGYAEKYLGRGAKNLATFSVFFGFLGAILAYLVVGGDFLSVLFGELSVGGFELGSSFYSIIFWAFGALLIYRGLKTISSIELGMSLFLISIIGLFFVVSLGQINLEYFGGINFDYTPVAYGVFLTAFAGYAAIPEMKKIAQGTRWSLKNNFKKLIIIGSSIPIFLYILFAFSVIGVTGKETSPEVMSGLSNIFGRDIVAVGAWFGILACFTSFLVLGVNLVQVFKNDWGLPKVLSWAMVVFIPLVGFILGLRDFIPIVSLVGAVMGGINGIIIILIHQKLSIKRRWFKKVLLLLFVAGLFFRICKFFY